MLLICHMNPPLKLLHSCSPSKKDVLLETREGLSAHLYFPSKTSTSQKDKSGGSD